MCDGRVGVLGIGCDVKNIVTIDTHRHGQSFCRVQIAFFKKLLLPFGERKTCLQVVFLMGLPVESAFELLLTRVTKPRPRKFRIVRNLASMISRSLHCSSSRQKVTLSLPTFCRKYCLNLL